MSHTAVVNSCSSAGVGATTIRNFGRSGGLSVDLVKLGEGSIATSAAHDSLQRWGDYSAVQVIDNRMWFAVPTTRLFVETIEQHEETEGKHHHKHKAAKADKADKAAHHNKAELKAELKAEHRQHKAAKHGHAETQNTAETHSSVRYATWISVRSLE
jgi:hypothetical protein